MEEQIIIGPDGWKAIIAQGFTVENISRVSQATAEWMKTQNFTKVVIGFDTRFGGKMFSRKIAKIMASYGFEVFISEKFVTTAMIANGVMELNADLGIYITGGTKPFFFSGLKLISKDGGLVEHQIESLIKEKFDLETKKLKQYKASQQIKVVNLEEQYYQRLIKEFDISAIRAADVLVVVDPIYGAGQKIWKRILPESLRLRSENNPTFDEKLPIPTNENLILMSQLVGETEYTSCGIGLGGAAEMINICDENGVFVDVDHIKSVLDLSEMKDGVWIALSLLQHLANTGKKVSEL
ncbi:phosphohexomutase domain-containing protein [Portibacter lacus]|uniref:Alpha-D-phosphohexomutase alpha/beta/alpha domain-containing protein n=1 Tax=Portibacter lacus TaxID=1099794 RepID=A0AA37SRA3_9BACT|nr:hypothetical protein [Portibacter lacus]GLR18647.1 hypothetical protein GCM10007940_32630 [Portibacter lacus]